MKIKRIGNLCCRSSVGGGDLNAFAGRGIFWLAPPYEIPQIPDYGVDINVSLTLPDN